MPDKNKLLMVQHKHLSQDSMMKSLIHSIELAPVSYSPNIFAALCKSIVSQQLSVKSAAAIYNRFSEFVVEIENPDHVLAFDMASLRSVGLSKQKASYILNIASFFKDYMIHDETVSSMTDQEIIDLLTKIKGVGKWTVQMILMFHLDRMDVFPELDLGIQNNMKKLYQLNLEKKELIQEIKSIAENWQPYRTLATRYIWASDGVTPM